MVFPELLGQRIVLCLEVTPPRGPEIDAAVTRLSLAPGLIDAINVTDNAMARVRMAAISCALLLRERLGIDVIMNMSCRDRNLLALQSDLIAADALGLHNVVALKGDPAHVRGGRAKATEVFEVNTLGLLRTIANLNEGHDMDGKPLNRPLRLFVGSVANPNAASLQREISLFARKTEAGAKYFLTQPVFSLETALQFLEETRKFPAAILLGVLPVRSSLMADNLATRIPGLSSTASVLAKYQSMTNEEVRQCSLEMSLDLMNAVKDRVAGFYLLTAGAPSLALRLAEQFLHREKSVSPLYREDTEKGIRKQK